MVLQTESDSGGWRFSQHLASGYQIQPVQCSMQEFKSKKAFLPLPVPLRIQQ